MGSGRPENYRLANNLEEDIEIWAMNMCHRWLTAKADRWFQIHPRSWHSEMSGSPGNEDKSQEGPFGRPLDHIEFLQTCGIPVYMQDVDPEIPTSVKYPLADVMGRFGGGYFTSTIPYMIALALYEGVDEIGLLGVYLTSKQDYTAHRPCVEFWLGVAKGMGVAVVLPDDCHLAEAPLYAYSDGREPLETLTLKTVEVVG
jgi:hypothetical protein|tara:strand:+ start:49 stop:648 length:600 start_codon:yes stop_codon:yes gene_type:complete